jgi:hypothetical protein
VQLLEDDEMQTTACERTGWAPEAPAEKVRTTLYTKLRQTRQAAYLRAGQPVVDTR